MEHDKYWAERFEQLTEAELRKADDLSAEMVKEYRQTAQDLNDDIQRWYARFAAENKMSLAEARRVLTGRELAEFRWTVDEYIKYAKKADLSEAYIQKLKNASARVHIDRLEAIRMQMAQHVEKLAAKGNARLTDVLRDIYPDAQMRTAYEVQKKKGFEPFARIPEEDVDRILKKPWVSDGLNFSDRIWRDKERLLNTLQGELTRGLIRGEPYGKIAQRIAGRMGVARSAAARLVETEAAFFSSRGQLDAFRDLGVEQYEFVATLDSKTSETCREMDGKVLPLSEFKPGITAPPLHCHCRSTTCPYFDDEFTEGETRAARDPETGKTVQVDSRLSYEEWKRIFVEQAETFEHWRMGMNLVEPSAEFIEELAKSQGKEYTKNKEKNTASFYMADDGITPIWPPNDGTVWHSDKVVLNPGSIILSRYGDSAGRYVSPAGTSYEERALAPNTDRNDEHWFVIQEPIEADRGVIAAWFNQKGGGIQYKLQERIRDLILSEMLKELSEDEYKRLTQSSAKRAD